MLVTQSCPTLCDLMDCSLSGSSVHGILQARILEWVAMPLSRGSSQTQESNLGLLHCRQILYCLNHLLAFIRLTVQEVTSSISVALRRTHFLNENNYFFLIYVFLVSKMVRQEMARVNIDILGISKLKWTGMGEFNSDDHYIYYCGQESLRRNGVAIIVNKRVQNAVLGCSLKNNKMIFVCFQGKPFNITVIQVYVPMSNAEEAEVERF